MNKVLMLFFGMLLLSCGSNVKTTEKGSILDKANLRKLIGKKVYVLEKATSGRYYYEKKYKEEKVSRIYNKCKPVEIVDFLGRTYSDTPEGIVFRQNGKTYLKTMVKLSSLSKELPFKKRMINFSSGKESSLDLLCSGNYWTGMTEKELYFVKGFPDKTNISASRFGTRKQLVYEVEEYKSHYFYIVNGKLTSWQI